MTALQSPGRDNPGRLYQPALIMTDAPIGGARWSFGERLAIMLVEMRQRDVIVGNHVQSEHSDLPPFLKRFDKGQPEFLSSAGLPNPSGYPSSLYSARPALPLAVLRPVDISW